MHFADRASILQAAPGTSPGRDTAVAPGQREANPRDEWPDDVRFWPTAPEVRFWPVAPAPAGPTRRTFLGWMLGAGVAVAAGSGAGRAIGSTVVPGPGPLEQAYRRWQAAIKATARFDDIDCPAYGTPEGEAHEARLGACTGAEAEARHELILAIAGAVGYGFTAPARVVAGACGPVATIREGSNLYLLTPDHESDGGRIGAELDESWGPEHFRPVVAEGVF